MKNNKLLYLLTIIITLFTFNTSVNAAQKLVCLYESSGEDITLAFIQDSNTPYKQYILENDKLKASINDSGWKKNTKVINFNDYSFSAENSLSDEGDGIFRQCPGSISNTPSQYWVYNGKNNASFKLYDEHKNETIEIKYEDFSVSDGKNPVSGKACYELKKDEKWLQSTTEWDSSKYQMACLYQKNINNQCEIIQLNVGKNERSFISSRQLGLNINIHVLNNSYAIDIIEKTFKGSCPKSLKVAIGNGNGKYGSDVVIDQGKTEIGLNWQTYSLINSIGKNILTDQDVAQNEVIINPNDNVDTCEELFGGDESMLKLVKFIINLVKIFIPIVLIGFGIADFGMAIFSGEEDKMKKAQKRFITRIIVAVIIFLIPTVLKMILTIANSIWPNIDATLCNLI